MKVKALSICCVIFLCFSCFAFGQSSSNKGTDFWVAYAGHIDDEQSRLTLFLSSDVNTTYTVKFGNTIISSGNIQANVVKPVFINPTIYDVYIGTSDVKEVGKGINITAQDNISVYAVISNNARTGGSLILPTATLEQEYYVFSEQDQGVANKPTFSEFTILATQDNTKINITPTKANTSGSRAANSTFEITLNKGDIYQYQAVNDLSGSHIEATSGCSPIAVFSGNTWVSYCENGNSRKPNGGDNLYQQLFPVSAWGRNFVSAPFYNTLNGNTDLIKIIVSTDNTIINVNGSTTQVNGTTLNNPYTKGSVITFATKDPSIIKASAPIAVAQYQTAQTCNLNNDPTASKGGPFLGDPEMTILNPIEQTLKDITVYSKLGSVQGVNTNILKYYLNVIIKTVDISGFTLDGQSITTLFKPIADGEYSYAVIDVTNSSDQHRLKAAGGFTAIAYGYGQVESYAYLAGTDLKNLKSNIQVFKPGASVSSTNFCLGTGFDFVLRLPYKTDKITWSLNNGAKVEVINNPSFTNIIEDGVTYYLYNYQLASNYFAAKGQYTVNTVIQKPTNATCAKDEEIFTNFEIFAPEISAPASACVNTDVQFNDSSTSTGGNIKTWKWDFGDGLFSSEMNPKHKFKTSGNKIVSLSVTTDLGCSLTTTFAINILDSPKADFVANGPFCINLPIKFTNQSTFVNSDIATQYWDFGNNTSMSNLASPTFIYSTPGIYQVKLITVSSAGCADTVIKPIQIVEPAEVTFDDPGSCVNDIVQFNAKVVKGNISSWLWDFGDGTDDVAQKNKQNPTHRYLSIGTYEVKLLAISTEGCSVVFTKTITINGNNPTSLYTLKSANNICANEALVLENNSKISFGKITKIEWIYDYKVGGANVVETDNNPEFGKIYSHSYPNSNVIKTYKLVMRVYSGQSCFTETSPITITVYPAPILQFEPINPVCENTLAFQLQAKETNNVLGSGIYSGKGISPMGLFNPLEAGQGTHTIKYTFTTNNGCKEEKSIDIVVNPLPILTIEDKIDILWGGQKQVVANLTGNNLSVKWTPSEGLSADNIINPVVSPKETTKYILTVSSGNCSFTKEVNVVVHDEPFIPNAFSPNSDGKNDTWNVKYFETLPLGKISVFNRYGQLVYYAAPYQKPWDAKVNGKEVPLGVYYYIIEPNNGRKKYSGTVTVLR